MQKVLLVDDDPSEADHLGLLLTTAGYEVELAESSEAALVILAQRRPDVVLSNFFLPGLSGCELCRVVRADPSFSTLPVVLITPGDDWQSALECIECGGDAFVTRPIDSATLLARLRSLLAQARASRGAGGEYAVRVDLMGRHFDSSSARRTTSALAYALEEALQANTSLKNESEELATSHRVLERYTHRLENEVELSDGKYRTLLRGAKVGILVTDPNGTLVEINERGEAMLGLSRRKALGRILFEGQANAPLDVKALLDGLSDGEPVNCEIALKEDDVARETWLELSVSPVGDQDDRLVLIIARDVTERHRTSDELRSKEAALLAALGERAKMATELLQAQKLEAVGQLAAGMAHEINTPTQYIGDNLAFLGTAMAELEPILSAYSELVELTRAGTDTTDALASVDDLVRYSRLPYLRAEVPRAVEQSLEGIGRVTSIVQAMKEFSHPGTAEKTSFDINRAIRSTVTVARNEWKYVADVELQLSDEIPFIPCLPGEFNQAILNLVINAAHAIGEALEGTDQKGKIVVKTRAVEGHVEISIADTGRGIPESIRDKVFNPFFTTKEVGKGTGQGLAIARSVIVEKHGGRLFFESTENVGTTFFIWLPLEERTSGEHRRSASR
jgi:PAS domain S-box-containing protein